MAKGLKIIARYTYLGVILDEHMVLTLVIHLVASHYFLLLASIMLMEIILIYNYMMPVLFQQCYMVLKFFGYINPSTLYGGSATSTPIQAMMGDIGWTYIYIKEVLCMLRYWNRNYGSLERRIFMWDYNKGG